MNVIEPTPKRTWRLRWPKLYPSTWVFMGFLAVVLGLLNVPGEEIVEPLTDLSVGWKLYDSWGRSFHHGWPQTAIRGTIPTDQGMQSSFPPSPPSPPLPPSPWNFSGDIQSLDWRAVAVNAGTGLGVLVAGGVLFQTWRKRRPSLRQFRLAELLILITLVSVGLQYLVRQRKAALADRATVLAIRDRDGKVTPHKLQPWGPSWLRYLVGDSQLAEFDRVVAARVKGNAIQSALPLRRLRLLTIDGPVSNRQLELLEDLPDLISLELNFVRSFPNHAKASDGKALAMPRLTNLRRLDMGFADFPTDWLENLPALEELELAGPGIGDEDVATIARIQNLRKLRLTATRVTSTGLSQLSGHTALESLAILQIVRMPIDKDKIRSLAKLLALRDLFVCFPLVDDESAQHLGSLRGLRSLHVWGSITDAAIPSLATLTTLKHLEFIDAGITKEGIAELQKALPDCMVLRGISHP